MKISDEMLSAFIDAELSEAAMEEIRCALESDDDLVMRLADLAQADHWVAENASVIDSTPMADNLLPLAQSIDKKIAKGKTTESAADSAKNVVSLSAWKNFNKSLQKPYALAAGVAMLFGVGTVTLMQSQQAPTVLTAGITQVLDQQRSGEISSIAQGDKITANLSFTNRAGDYCRQFQRVSEQTASVNIACKENGLWQLKITEKVKITENTQNYRAASNQAQLDSAIDVMINGPAMDSAQEQRAIANNWQTEQQ
ncbi:hypothetical protein H4J51_10365 [Colwellia sp. MB02u-18]|uniref:hypothetical protein n=1 Tax=unclassified Colwellia TaxID=196834 RepID=UPI0015F49494|nr:MULTISPECIES: hypothetical protein [unclassified Colwellia]MBA6225585.1 hypothetical protein [Colwellia sp. MB3u-45]MBA6266727.1 hypothetical protein [Colwellia sp. MB3u-43]MBA6321745.1 hypothetical protein [Colwellia sp. MB02u-19]MBA6324975.1 hypothetical protein [Colwellia sp. MB02u-18]MBA6331340.1 hypothetical protein [Colwellia sp. MB02u-12]